MTREHATYAFLLWACLTAGCRYTQSVTANNKQQEGNGKAQSSDHAVVRVKKRLKEHAMHLNRIEYTLICRLDEESGFKRVGPVVIADESTISEVRSLMLGDGWQFQSNSLRRGTQTGMGDLGYVLLVFDKPLIELPLRLMVEDFAIIGNDEKVSVEFTSKRFYEILEAAAHDHAKACSRDIIAVRR